MSSQAGIPHARQAGVAPLREHRQHPGRGGSKAASGGEGRETRMSQPEDPLLTHAVSSPLRAQGSSRIEAEGGRLATRGRPSEGSGSGEAGFVAAAGGSLSAARGTRLVEQQDVRLRPRDLRERHPRLLPARRGAAAGPPLRQGAHQPRASSSFRSRLPGWRAARLAHPPLSVNICCRARFPEMPKLPRWLRSSCSRTPGKLFTMC